MPNEMAAILEIMRAVDVYDSAIAKVKDEGK